MSKISNEDKKELLALKQNELTITLMAKLFGKTTSTNEGKFEIKEPRFNVRHEMHLDANEYINEKVVDTTVGIFLFNKILIEGLVEDIVPNHYYNEVVNAKAFWKLMDMISEGLLMGKIPVQPTFVKWLKQYEFYGMKAVTIFSPSYTEGLLKKNPAITKKKKELLKGKNVNDVKEMSEIEDELVAASREVLKNDPGMTLFDSGARGSFENDYKNMNLMLGPVSIPGQEGKFDLVTSNYIDGIQKKDIVSIANSAVAAIYPKAIGTQDSGYLTKKYYAAYQSIQCDDDGTDCGTKMGLDVVLTKDNVNGYFLQNIITDKGYETLTKDNESKFLGKRVTFRSPMFCKNDKLCSVCSGRRFYLMNLRNIGLTAGRITNTMLNASMKNFHNAKVKYDEVNINDLLVN